MANGTEGTGKVYGLGNGSGRLVNVFAAGDSPVVTKSACATTSNSTLS